MFRVLFLLLLIFLSAGSATSKERPVIIVDAGHGGRDPGTVSKRNRIREKELALSISRKLVGKLETKTGGRVYLTRTGDRFLDLEERNRLANWRGCNLFLSIHANSAEDRDAEGVEIYYLNKATDEAAQRLADRENSNSRRRIKDVDAIMSDLIQTASAMEAADLAQEIKRSLDRKMRHDGLREIRTKTALFYVLVGAKCPSLLIETGFITNPREAGRLKRAQYQSRLADAIAEGVRRYLNSRSRSKNDL